MFEVPQGLPEIHVSEPVKSLKWRILNLPNHVVLQIQSDNMGWVLINNVYLRPYCLSNSSFCIREGLGEAYDGDIAFASSLETFGGGHNDPISVAFGG
jgi:hypothetical protein